MSAGLQIENSDIACGARNPLHFLHRSVFIVDSWTARIGAVIEPRYSRLDANAIPFHTSSAKKLNVTDPPIITVIGKA